MLKWGICCCGQISQDFTSALCEYEDSKNKAIAVAARNEDSAKLFAERFGLKYYFGGYENLALCDEVDIVYVGSTDSEHCKLTKLFLNHGKHVLVEKTMGRNVAETKEMIELAREKKLFLMEGIWSLFLPVYKKIKDITLDDSIGTITHVNATFQYPLKSETVWSKEIGRGGLRGLGIYVIKFALWVFHNKKVENISGTLKRTQDGIDMCGNIMMEFEGNATAFVSFHVASKGESSASVYGDKGSIVIPHTFWTPEFCIINDKEDRSLSTKRNNLNMTYNFDNGWQFTHEIHHVSDCIERGLLESDIHPLSETLRLAEIMEELLKEK